MLGDFFFDERDWKSKLTTVFDEFIHSAGQVTPMPRIEVVCGELDPEYLQSQQRSRGVFMDWKQALKLSMQPYSLCDNLLLREKLRAFSETDQQRRAQMILETGDDVLSLSLGETARLLPANSATKMLATAYTARLALADKLVMCQPLANTKLGGGPFFAQHQLEEIENKMIGDDVKDALKMLNESLLGNRAREEFEIFLTVYLLLNSLELLHREHTERIRSPAETVSL